VDLRRLGDTGDFCRGHRTRIILLHRLEIQWIDVDDFVQDRATGRNGQEESGR